jgi:hypothetical protein
MVKKSSKSLLSIVAQTPFPSHMHFPPCIEQAKRTLFPSPGGGTDEQIFNDSFLYDKLIKPKTCHRNVQLANKM